MLPEDLYKRKNGLPADMFEKAAYAMPMPADRPHTLPVYNLSTPLTNTTNNRELFHDLVPAINSVRVGKETDYGDPPIRTLVQDDGLGRVARSGATLPYFLRNN